MGAETWQKTRPQVPHIPSAANVLTDIQPAATTMCIQRETESVISFAATTEQRGWLNMADGGDAGQTEEVGMQRGARRV